jgi:hypothetical protein
MRPLAAIVSAFALLMLSADAVSAWSLRDEVVVIDPNLAASTVWELVDSKPYCDSGPGNLDRLSCAVIPDPAEFWIGLDAAGNAYGTVNGADALGEYFDIYRRPVGTKQSQHIVRITKRKEPVFGQITKIQLTAGSAIDATSGVLLVALTGSCLSAACVAQSDTEDHLAVIRVTGLPTLFDLALSYAPPSALALKLPARPYALPSTDRVDVYYGPVTAMQDLSSALPLACDVAPASGPGDIVPVADSLPAPSVGQGRYYLATVSAGGERRAGRRLVGGVLGGRPAAGMPACP